MGNQQILKRREVDSRKFFGVRFSVGSTFTKSLVAALMVICFSVSAHAVETGVYGAKFEYGSKEPFKFHDFEIQFTATKPGPAYPNSTRRMGDVFEFTVRSEGQTQDVTWSSGTGDIGPSFFAVGKKCFRLELSHSDKIGKLDSDEAVVSVEENDYCR